jgi:hypothetical protein
VTVPGWAWATFLAFVIALLVLDVFVLHRRAGLLGTYSGLTIRKPAAPSTAN